MPKKCATRSSRSRCKHDLPIPMSLIQRLIFNLWYYRRPPWDSGITPPELLEFLATTPPGRAIDLGCGTGTNVITLARRGWQVMGVDFAPRAITIAKQKARNKNIQADWRVGDVTKLDGISGPFDFALDLGCFHSLSPAGRGLYLARLDELLAPGGSWLMYGFFNPSPAQTTLGLAPVDIDLILRRFSLVSRQDGFDRKERSSAYFLFQKPVEHNVIARRATPDEAISR